MKAPDSASDWSRIQAAGALVVGTSAAYPPFEYYNDSFQIDGFDPALMKAIGAELGVEVVFKDFAFDGLSSALALGQSDVAIAALTVTPERARVMAFTAPYFASTEGYLARAGADLPAVTSTGDLAGLRIGIERGSIYEQWLQNLATSGALRAEDLILYTTVETAVTDLAEERIDLVISDLPAAQALAKTGDFKLAGSGLFAQQYAMAVRPGSEALLGRLDAALATLQQNGSVARLAERYLGVTAGQLAPLSNESAAQTAASVPAARSCVDGMAWAGDLSYDDHAMTTPAVMVPAQAFVKGWRVQNTGTCTWNNGYQLAFSYGNAPGASMGGQPVAVQGNVEPGATYDIEAQLVAPITSGLFQGVWQMQNARGRQFGESLRVGIQVAGSPTPTPLPTQTPVPGIAFAADATQVRQGEAVTFNWDVQDAGEVYFYRAGQEWQDKRVESKGSSSDLPSDTTTYNLRVVRANGQEEIREITVYVEPMPDLPQISYFAVEPSGQVTAGQCVNLRWQIAGAVDRVTIFKGKETLWDDAPVEGTFEDCPAATGVVDYAVGASGAAGVNYDVETIEVTSAKSAAAHAAENQAAPVIDAFAVLPAEVEINGCVEVSWKVGGDVTLVRILRDGVVLMDGADKIGSGRDCLTEPGSHAYRLESSSDSGVTATSEVTVTAGTLAVTPSPAAVATTTDNELAGKELVAVSFRGPEGNQISPLVGTQITAAFTAGGRLAGSTGCNRYMGTYQAAGGTITISPIGTTRKVCLAPVGVMDQEAQYVSVLPAAAAYKVEGSQLTLLDGTGNIVAVYVATR